MVSIEWLVVHFILLLKLFHIAPWCDLGLTLCWQDYVDAFEKLLRLSLSHQQEREIIHVTLDVCLQETPYNPYYAFIAQKFSECHRRHQVRGQGYVPTLVYLLMSTNTIRCVGYVQMCRICPDV